MKLTSSLRWFIPAIVILFSIFALKILVPWEISEYINQPPPPLQEVVRTANGITFLWSNGHGGEVWISRDIAAIPFQQFTTQFVGRHSVPSGNPMALNRCSVSIYYGKPQPTMSAASTNCPVPARYTYLPDTGELGRDGEWVDMPVKFQKWFLIQQKASIAAYKSKMNKSR